MAPWGVTKLLSAIISRKSTFHYYFYAKRLVNNLSQLDIIIFIGYIVVVSFIGFYSGRFRNNSARDYFITSGGLPWYLVGFSLIASSISTEQFIGSAGFAYRWGVPVLNWELAIFIAMLVMIWIFLPVYLRNRIIIVPEYLEKRLGKGSRNLYAIITGLCSAVMSTIEALVHCSSAIFILDLYKNFVKVVSNKKLVRVGQTGSTITGKLEYFARI